MRITCIKITEKANLGNYESLEFSAEAVMDEDDNQAQVTENLTDYVNWHAHRPIRETKARAYRKILATEQSTPEQKAEAEAWLKKYDERKAKVEAL
jgi:hypothetical protein